MKDVPQVSPPKYIRFNEFRARFGIGKTKAYELLNAREIRAKKVGRATLVEVASADAWIERQPDFCKKPDSR